MSRFIGVDTDLRLVSNEHGEINDAMAKAQFASRSEAGRYAAHIRWARQNGAEPMTPEQWKASQTGSGSPSASTGRKTPTGKDWDEKPPVFATMSEALDWLNAKWSSDEIIGVFRSSGSTPAWTAQNFAEAMDSMFKEMPEVCLSINKIEWVSETLGAKGGALGWAGRSTAPYIGFNSMLFGREKMVEGAVGEFTKIPADKAFQQMQTDRYLQNRTATASVRGTFYHEMGHHLLYQAANLLMYDNKDEVRSSLWASDDDEKKYDRAAADLISPIIRRVYNLPGRGRVKLADLRNTVTQTDLSSYALTNYDEFVAECVHRYFAAKFEPSVTSSNRIATEVTETLLKFIRTGEVPQGTKKPKKVGE